MTQTAVKLPSEIDHIHNLVADDITAMTALTADRLVTRVDLIDQLAKYIIYSGGKRLRPTLVLLSAHALGYDGPEHIKLATIIEFVHTATLLHDDVVDDSSMRRGQDTANAVWGPEASVLVGDFLYSRAFQMMVEVNDMTIMGVLADATNTIATGEVQQLMNCHNPDISEAEYLDVITNKTAKLFQAAAKLGAVIAKQPAAVVSAMGNYGKELGIAFQLIDDMLDYSASSELLGKNIGDDLAEGKPTLPLIFAMREGNPEQRQNIRSAIQHGGRDTITEITAAIESTGAIAYTADAARQAATRAVESLTEIPPSPYRDALISLADFSVSRSY